MKISAEHKNSWWCPAKIRKITDEKQINPANIRKLKNLEKNSWFELGKIRIKGEKVEN